MIATDHFGEIILDHAFSPEQWQTLQQSFRLKPAQECDFRVIEVSALLDENCCAQLLDQLGPTIGAPNRKVTASLLAKRIAFLTTGACLYAMSVYDKGLSLTPENSLIDYAYDEGLWTSSMPLHSLAASTYSSGQRAIWREQIVQILFADLLAPLWQVLHKVGRVSLSILWENTAVRVYSLYERKMVSVVDPVALQRARKDFDWLLQAPGSLFAAGYNPLQRFRQPVQQTISGPVRYRRTCCFYYKASCPQEYCSTCPLIKKHPTVK